MAWKRDKAKDKDKAKEKPAKEKPPKPAKVTAVARPKPVRGPKPPRPPGEPVYTVLAAVTLAAVLVGSALLYLDFDEYGKQSPPAEKIPALPRLVEDARAAPAPGS